MEAFDKIIRQHQIRTGMKIVEVSNQFYVVNKRENIVLFTGPEIDCQLWIANNEAWSKLNAGKE